MSQDNKATLENMIEKLSEKMERLYDDTDRRLDNIEKVMIAQEINLTTHMRRSDNLEALLQTVKEQDIKPIQRHVAMVDGVFKFLGLVSVLFGILAGVIKLFS